jgi:hypothetical protein
VVFRVVCPSREPATAVPDSTQLGRRARIRIPTQPDASFGVGRASPTSARHSPSRPAGTRATAPPKRARRTRGRCHAFWFPDGSAWDTAAATCSGSSR